MPAGKRPQAATESSGYFRDYGGNSRGHGVAMSGSTQGICSSCGRYQYVPSIGWRRKIRPTCKSCGSLLVPSKAAQRRNCHLRSEAPPASERRCNNCNAKLRDGNKDDRCSPCQQNPNWLSRRGRR